MNKLAAEKIAQQYYQVGQQLALESMGMTKESNVKSKLLKSLGITAGGTAGLGAMNNAEAIAKMLGASAGPGSIARDLEGLAGKIVNSPGAIAGKVGDAVNFAGDKADDLLAKLLGVTYTPPV